MICKIISLKRLLNLLVPVYNEFILPILLLIDIFLLHIISVISYLRLLIHLNHNCIFEKIFFIDFFFKIFKSQRILGVKRRNFNILFALCLNICWCNLWMFSVVLIIMRALFFHTFFPLDFRFDFFIIFKLHKRVLLKYSWFLTSFDILSI